MISSHILDVKRVKTQGGQTPMAALIRSHDDDFRSKRSGFRDGARRAAGLIDSSGGFRL